MIDVPTLVKDALRDGRRLKNYRFNVLNDDGTTDFSIDNDNLVSESVKFDERMCSDNILKFGLCEGTSLEFQYFGFENINGRRIEAYCDVQWQGYETTQSYERVRDCGRYQFINITEAGNYIIVNESIPLAWAYISLVHDGTTTTIEVSSSEDYESYSYLGDLVAGDYFEVVWETTPIYTATLMKQVETEEYGLWYYPVPMGFFDVKKCPMQISTGIYKVTAYNKLMSDYFDTKANEQLIAAMSDSALSILPTITLDNLLSIVLQDYAISYGTDVDYSVDMASQRTNRSSALYYKECDSEGNLTGYYINIIIAPIEINWDGISEDDTVRFIIDNTLIIDNVYSELVEGTNFETSYLLYQGDVMSVENYFNLGYYQAYLESQYLDSESERQVARVILTSPGIYYSKYIKNLKVISTQPSGDSEIRGIPGYVYRSTSIPSASTVSNYNYFSVRNAYKIAKDAVKMIKLNQSELGSITVDPSALPDVTLRQLQSAVFETECEYGKLDRVTDLFSGIELNQSILYPADTLYPADDLYPSGTLERSIKSLYSKLWYDNQGTQTFRNLIITYKDSDGNDATLTTVVNADGTTDYVCDNNWLFKNLNWTEGQIQTYADAMITKMQSISWFPFEMWGAGLPYIEAGDMIEIVNTSGETEISYVLQRQLQGIQNLQDTYSNGTLDVF